MNGELLTVLDYIEREKGINRKTLIEAVESALLSAAKKTFGVKETDSIRVDMDMLNGEFKVFLEDKEMSSEEFGRIAAQTAKQVIIQKIREAERNVIFEEFQEKMGEIVTGTVHRFEKGAIIVDLGKTEGVLSKKEQVFKEDYRQGNRIRAIVLEVRTSAKGPEIVLSRRTSGLVKKLFELEVPEIYEGIVEIKAIAREAGDRTKIAVYSKDDKIDSVGACVGMRGSRVKNIVRELNGEKIDIVKWNPMIADYVTAALNPAEISKIEVFDKDKKVRVIVEDDKLSLAIGKKGQNVRLASKLTEWEIDIKGIKDLKEEAATDISQLEGVGAKTAETLKEVGFDTLDKLSQVSLEELKDVPGVGGKTAAKIIIAAKAKLNELKESSKAKDIFKETDQVKEVEAGEEAEAGDGESQEDAE